MQNKATWTALLHMKKSLLHIVVRKIRYFITFTIAIWQTIMAVWAAQIRPPIMRKWLIPPCTTEKT